MAFIMFLLNPREPRCSLVPFLALLLAMSGCTDTQTRENNRLREEIITVHDEAMEKVGYLYELEIKLHAISTADQLRRQSIDKAIADLQQANTKMFDWMHQYQTLAVSQDIVEDSRYREQQLHLIQEVQRLTDESIERSEIILNDSQQ